MGRIKFTTTLEDKVVECLKIQAVKEKTDVNRIIERLVKNDQELKKVQNQM